MSTFKISRGPRVTPIRAVIYGVEGIGKSTLASFLPKPVFLDIEGSTNQLDVARVDISTAAQLGSTIASLAADPQGFKTVAIDTADWAERLVLEDLLKRTGKKSVEDFGFGKGYTHLAEEFSRILTLTDGLISKGLHVVWIAHSKVVRQSPPDQTDGFDRYELKLSKQIAPLLKEWSDLLLFAKFKLQMVEGTDGRIKAQGGKKRVIHATNSAAWDAKNRFGLPDEIILEAGLPESISAIFAGSRAKIAEKAPAPVAAPVAEPTLPEPSAAIFDPEITAEQLAKIQQYGAIAVCVPVIDKALKHYGQPLDLLTEMQAAKIISRCQEEMNAATEKKPTVPTPAKAGPGAFPWPADVRAWFEANEKLVNNYLFATAKWIGSGETFRDIKPDLAEKLIRNLANFAKAAGISPLTKAA